MTDKQNKPEWEYLGSKQYSVSIGRGAFLELWIAGSMDRFTAHVMGGYDQDEVGRYQIEAWYCDTLDEAKIRCINTAKQILTEALSNLKELEGDE